MSTTPPRFDLLPDPLRQQRDALQAGWLLAAAGGDTDAFERFYDATVAMARAVARRRLHECEIEDLLADAFFEAWRGAARFDPGRGSPLAWLLSIVKSRALDLCRRRVTQPSLGARDPALDDDVRDPAPDACERLALHQAGARLHLALRRLTAAERWVVGLAYFRELTHSEIASRTGLPLGTVKSHLLRGQNKLRAALAV